MHNPVTTMTDKVMRMARAMVYLALCATRRGGATVGEIAGFLRIRAPGEAELYHEGMVERALRQLEGDGRVTREGARWHLVVDG